MTVSVHSALDPTTVARLSGLQLRAKYVVDGYLSGQHRSPHRGQSVEFAEHREYAPGDDLRYLDWKALARSDRVYLKQFENETNLVCHLAVDVSESMSYRSEASPLSKFDYTTCLAAALAHLVIGGRDSVGLATFDESLQRFLPDSGSPSQLAAVVRILQSQSPQGKSQVGLALDELASRMRSRRIIVVISDCLSDVESLAAGLRHLRYQRNEVILLQVLDPAELDFPFDRATLFRGLEAQLDLFAEPQQVRRAYLDAVGEFLQRIQAICRDNRIDYQLTRTDEPFDAPLRRMLTARAVRRR